MLRLKKIGIHLRILLVMKMADDGTFGFDDLEKAFKKAVNKYPEKSDALLMAGARLAQSKTKTDTPVGKTKKLRSSWRVKPPKSYGQSRVVRVQSQATHAHLVELGHQIVRGGKLRKGGRELNVVQRAVRGITVGGRVEGKFMLEKAMKGVTTSFDKDVDTMLDKLIGDLEL